MYSALGRSSNYELISFAIDGEISAKSRESRSCGRIITYATPLAYVIKAILIRDDITYENTESAHSRKFIRPVHQFLNSIPVDDPNFYPRLLFTRRSDDFFIKYTTLITRPIQLVSATWRFSRNTMQISYYINKVWRWIIFVINNAEGHFASSRPAECALGRALPIPVEIYYLDNFFKEIPCLAKRYPFFKYQQSIPIKVAI